MTTRITKADMNWYYRNWARIRAIKPYFWPVPDSVPVMSCQPRWMPPLHGGTIHPNPPPHMGVRAGCQVPPGLVVPQGATGQPGNVRAPGDYSGWGPTYDEQPVDVAQPVTVRAPGAYDGWTPTYDEQPVDVAQAERDLENSLIRHGAAVAGGNPDAIKRAEEAVGKARERLQEALAMSGTDFTEYLWNKVALEQMAADAEAAEKTNGNGTTRKGISTAGWIAILLGGATVAGVIAYREELGLV